MHFFQPIPEDLLSTSPKFYQEGAFDCSFDPPLQSPFQPILAVMAASMRQMGDSSFTTYFSEEDDRFLESLAARIGPNEKPGCRTRLVTTPPEECQVFCLLSSRPSSSVASSIRAQPQVFPPSTPSLSKIESACTCRAFSLNQAPVDPGTLGLEAAIPLEVSMLYLRHWRELQWPIPKVLQPFVRWALSN
jgi:hypothetical protein